MNAPPPLPKKKPAVFHHPLGFELYDGLAMDLHAMAYAEPMLKEIEELRDSLAFYKRRCDALQEWQSSMRDPERTVVCDVLANGCTLPASHAGDRYGDMTPNELVVGPGKMRSVLHGPTRTPCWAKTRQKHDEGTRRHS